MNRRGFLSALAAAVAGPMVLDPERLLFVPGRKLISIPVTLGEPFKSVEFEYSAEEIMFLHEEFWQRYVSPALREFANELDRQLFQDHRRITA